MNGSQIVEVYSAANAVETHFLCDALREADIEAQVVNEGLAAGSGVLPFGETVAPRIWVRESDAPRARTIIAECLATENLDRDRQTDATNDVEADPANEADDSEAAVSLSARPRSAVEKLMVGVALALMLFGFFRAGRTFIAVRNCTVPIEALLATSKTLSTERRISRYVYTVDQRTYEVKFENQIYPSDIIDVLYNPDAPQQHVLWPPPNWEPDFFIGLAGVVLLFVVWRIG